VDTQQIRAGAPSVTLNNGVTMPTLALGVFKTKAGSETDQAVRWALEAGYRHIDTARIYGNERDVGLAVAASGVPREEVFITTKVWNSDQGYRETLRAFDESLRLLGTGYIDLYLVHWPVPGRRDDTWKALQDVYAQGRCHAIGVSNYTIAHLDELLAWADVRPAVNQVEFSPYLYQRDLLEHCREAGVQLEAYSPLTRGRRLGDHRLAAIADAHGKTPAQVLIRWVLQHDAVAIPKSVRRARIHENAAVFDFELTPTEMAVLDALDERLRTGWDPSDET
jgi:diketogulonate reductase-like aldo/keto reductase